MIDEMRTDAQWFRQRFHGRRSPGAALLVYLAHPVWPALVLARLAAAAPVPIARLARWRLIRTYGCDVEHGAQLGDSLFFAHPLGIVVAGDVRLDRRTELFHNVTLGQGRGGCPTVGADVRILPGAVVVGGISIGAGAQIGANAFVSADVPAGAIVPGGTRWTYENVRDVAAP